MEGMMIKEAAKRLNVEAHVLRYWEDELGLEIKRNSMGHRYYDERDIKLFNEVKQMKAQGLALKDIRNAIIKHKQSLEKVKNIEEEKKTEVNPDNNDDKQDKPCENVGCCDEAEQEYGSEMIKNIYEYAGDKVKETDVKVVDFKQAQLQNIMNKIVANALRENKDIITTSIKAEITADVMRQFDAVMREKEEREEARFRKLDGVLREMQRANAEVAATRARKRLFRKG